MIQAIIFDLDNTLTDFMKMKRAAIDAAVDGMIDAGLTLSRSEISEKIYKVYDREGIEYQQVFDRFLNEELDHIDYKILSSAIVAYRRARDSSLVLYPHVNLTLMELAKLPNCWIKVCGAERIDFPPYDKAVPVARAIIEALPDRTMWGTDFPHPNASHEADEGELVDLLPQFGDARALARVLVDNPARLYDFV